MAILIEKPVANLMACGISGVTASYWKITEVYGQLLEGTSVIKLSGYVNAEARQAGLSPVDSKQVSFTGADSLFHSSVLDVINPIALAYNKLKTLPEFQGCTDV